MTKNDFLAKIVEILDSTEEVTFETTLSDIEEWDSITVISVAAFLDSLGKKVTVDELKKVANVEELAKLAGVNE